MAGRDKGAKLPKAVAVRAVEVAKAVTKPGRPAPDAAAKREKLIKALGRLKAPKGHPMD